jgi:hypothetical protein
VRQPIAVGLVALMVLAFGIGFFCFAIIIKEGATALYPQYGMYTIILGIGAGIGLLPIGFLFDRQEALKRQPPRCPHCGQEPGFQRPSDRFSSEIEGHALHLDREAR